MDLYGINQHVSSIEEMGNSNALLEAYIVDDVLKGTSDQIKQFCESDEAQILVEKNVLNKPTLHRLSKADDFKRRVKLASYQLAKEAKDPEWAKLIKYNTLKKQSANKILNKYGKKAERIAKIGQKNYIKKAKSIKATAQEKKVEAAR